jgi:hypothetical protein
MRLTRREKIEKIIKVLEEQMRALKSVGLQDCASLVRIAWLDLRRRNDRISIRELQALCNRVMDEPEEEKPGKTATKPSRRRKSARIIDMQAWRSRINQ